MADRWRGFLRQAQRHGWTVAKTRGGHYKLTKPGCQTQFTSHTPSDRRALANMEARMRRAERNST